jgi:hypothetical protein
VAALTAAAASPTPTITPTSTLTPTPTSTPTPTPTPIPYDLSVLVTGDEDAPIVEAIVVLAEIGTEVGTQITDDVGQAIWTDLPGETVNLSISAQGYFSTETTETIERGENLVSVVLERDPFGLLTTEVCGPGENILYIEDLQDGHADGWYEIEMNAFGWDIGPHPDEPEDFVIVHSGDNEGVAGLENFVFGNVVWRVRFMTVGPPWIGFILRAAPEPYETDEGLVEDSRYVVNLENIAYINRYSLPIRSSWLSGNPHKPKTGIWHLLEISAYEGELAVWIDGYRILAYKDPNPLPEGGIWIELRPSGAENIFYFDDIALCELTASFVSLPTLGSE